jgi:dUTP pyrophosphatase
VASRSDDTLNSPLKSQPPETAVNTDTAAVEDAIAYAVAPTNPRVTVTAGRLHRGTTKSGGYDLFTTAAVTLLPGQRALVPTGVYTRMEDGVVALLRDRSGVVALGVYLEPAVLAGLIDGDYEGEWKVVLLNTGGEIVALAKGDRVCQVLFLNTVHDVSVEGTAEVTSGGVRGTGGFGSTGGGGNSG